ncbi:chemotaxis protein MotB [Alicyclobacillus cellulosilyticus]|uniref:Chemotaxis protein MotB n=1 Tax=Alicyclobacillus cellulosilyticus TaxID=1003997 RepID=A0A917KBR0_9BACL|nr:flagellar motor protein MotB [Alicyclobacillus cellulosilyticus]GGJ05849.1 chemotaxis protein MotB [Alicyclobacillus cellulosilyticus]
MRRPFKTPHTRKQNHERWLITYADLITLLMIFFVVMYAMSQINQVKFIALERSLAAALHKSDEIPLDNLGKTALINAANPSDTGNKAHPGVQTHPAKSPNDKALDNLFQEVQNYIRAHHLQGNVTVYNEARGVRITLRDVVLFDTGKADIRPQARALLAGLVPFFKQVNNPILVEGFTDNRPISTPQFPSNWELSAARAIGVVRFFQSQGIAGDRLAGVGYGQYHPVAPNDTDAHRQLNRRVNVVILRQP